jgi:lysophospholipase L1-like esterase
VAVACASDEVPNGTIGIEAEHVVDPECITTIGTEFPAQHPAPASPERISELTRILCGDEAVKAILSGRELGRDLWVRISYVYEHMEALNTGERPIAMVNLYFDPPLSYSGEVPVQTDPCSGHYGNDERLDPDDPCMAAAKEYGRRHQEFINETGVVAEVDFRRGEVVELFAVPFAVAPEEMADIRGEYGGAAYVSIGDPVQAGERARLSGELFRQYLSKRLNRPVDWVAFPGHTIDEFIHGSGGGTSELERAVAALAAWRREGRPVVAITLGIGGSDLVEVGTECHARGKQSCPDIFGEALTNYVEQLPLILTRLNEAKDPNTPLLLLTYYNASDCGQPGVELSPDELGVQGWNQAIIGAAKANGAFLADTYTPFKGHGCEYTSHLHPNDKGYAAIAEVYEEVYGSLPSEFVEPFALPAVVATAGAASP